MGKNKLLNNWHKYCDELDKASLKKLNLTQKEK